MVPLCGRNIAKNQILRIFLSICFFIASSVQLFGQIDEVGFAVGGTSYSGDISRGYKLLDSKPAGMLYIRRNFNDHLSMRFGLMAGKLTASDASDPIDAFAAARDASFSISMVEFSMMFEYHFLNFKTSSPLERWSPYFTGGLSLFAMSGHVDKPRPYSNFQPAIPIGVGIKYTLNPKWMLGVEWSARKLFFDYLDNVSEGDLQVKNYQYGNWYDNDSYYFIGVSINYAFYRIPCPFPYN